MQQTPINYHSMIVQFYRVIIGGESSYLTKRDVIACNWRPFQIDIFQALEKDSLCYHAEYLWVPYDFSVQINQ